MPAMSPKILCRLPGGTEGCDFAWLAQHLVDLARVKLLCINHLPGVFLDDDRASFGAFQQLAVEGKRFCLGFRDSRMTASISVWWLSSSGPIASDG